MNEKMVKMSEEKTIAIVAHDNKKEDLLAGRNTTGKP